MYDSFRDCGVEEKAPPLSELSSVECNARFELPTSPVLAAEHGHLQGAKCIGSSRSRIGL